MLELHGRGIDPVTFDRWTGYASLADEAGFVLARPAAVGEIWNDGRYRGAGWRAVEEVDDVGYLLGVVDDVCGRLPVDRARVYVVGMSNGAVMAGRLACEHAERLAGVAQVAGTAAVDVAATCRPAAPVPVLSIHGSADRFAPYEGGRSRGIRARLVLRRPAGPCVGVDDWARLWAGANGAGVDPEVEQLPPDTTIRRWHGPTPASDLVFYRVEGGGHRWPGERVWVPPILGRTTTAFDATRTSWAFLAAHRRG